jgi:hypothetical protein
MVDHMRSTLVWLLALGTLAGCETPTQRIQHEERDLQMDGFLRKPANTPERRAMLNRLTPNSLVRLPDEATPLYVSSDPTLCNCLYVGNQSAYNNYKADRQSLTDHPYDGGAWDWDAWGPWPEGYPVTRSDRSR